jgi:hypothetical protein
MNMTSTYYVEKDDFIVMLTCSCGVEFEGKLERRYASYHETDIT